MNTSIDSANGTTVTMLPDGNRFTTTFRALIRGGA